MNSFLLLLEKWRDIWPGALGALAIFIPLSILAWPYFQRPPQPCEARLSPLSLKVQVNKSPKIEVILEETSKTLEPIEVNPNDSVEITTEIQPQPEMCAGTFSVDWRLVFNSRLAEVETISELPTHSMLKVKVDTQAADNLIELIVRDAFNNVKKKVFLPLKVKENN